MLIRQSQQVNQTVDLQLVSWQANRKRHNVTYQWFGYFISFLELNLAGNALRQFDFPLLESNCQLENVNLGKSYQDGVNSF